MKRLSEIISGPEKWTQGWYARDSAGEEVTSSDPAACKYCLVGAALKIAAHTPELYSEVHIALSEAITEVIPGSSTTIPFVNDSRSWETISQIIAKADEILENKGFFKNAEQR